MVKYSASEGSKFTLLEHLKRFESNDLIYFQKEFKFTLIKYGYNEGSKGLFSLYLDQNHYL